MDAAYDDSDILTLEYGVKGLGRFSDLFTFELYGSKEGHPMTLRYRNSVKKKGIVCHWLENKAKGAKLKHRFSYVNHTFTIGLDVSLPTPFVPRALFLTSTTPLP